MSAYDPTQTLASLFALVLNQKTEVTENTHGVSYPHPAAEVKRGNSDSIVNISSRRKKPRYAFLSGRDSGKTPGHELFCQKLTRL